MPEGDWAILKKKDVFFVTMQLVLLGVYPLGGLTFPSVASYGFPNRIGLLIAGLGSIIVLIVISQLHNNLSIFPSPKRKGQLITNGLYEFIRHHVYMGIILTVFGYAIFQQSLWKLIVALAIYALLYFKAKYEESLLIEKFEDYRAYMKQTEAFFPKLPRTNNSNGRN